MVVQRVIYQRTLNKGFGNLIVQARITNDDPNDYRSVDCVDILVARYSNDGQLLSDTIRFKPVHAQELAIFDFGHSILNVEYVFLHGEKRLGVIRRMVSCLTTIIFIYN